MGSEPGSSIESTGAAMKQADETHPPAVMLRPHSPERRIIRSLARGEIAAHCCTCCCLHSVGSLAGALAGSFFPREAHPSRAQPMAKLRDDEIGGPPGDAPDRSAVRSIYWMVTLGSTVLVSLYAVVQSQLSIEGPLFALAIFMPAIQLGASVLCLLFLAAIPELRRDARAWRRLGWIALGTIAGAATGILIMYIYAKFR